MICDWSHCQVMGLAWTNMGGATLFIEARGAACERPVDLISLVGYGWICGWIMNHILSYIIDTYIYICVCFAEMLPWKIGCCCLWSCCDWRYFQYLPGNRCSKEKVEWVPEDAPTPKHWTFFSWRGRLPLEGGLQVCVWWCPIRKLGSWIQAHNEVQKKMIGSIRIYGCCTLRERERKK